MSDNTTKRMLNVYKQNALPTRFLSGFFQSPPKNFYDQMKVEIDIVREDEDVAIAVTDVATGYRMNSADDFTNKEFMAPAYKEAFPLNSFKLYNRVAGQDPFADLNFRANVLAQMFDGMSKIERKIRRAIEMQSAEVLQTGTVTLIDSAGKAIYTIDYSPKATHFPQVSVSWATSATATPISDLISICNVIRNDGLDDPTRAIMGEDAFENMLNVTTAGQNILTRLDTRRADLGAITPLKQGGTKGGNYRGTLDLGNFKIDIWTYGGRYKHPQTGVKTQYLSPTKVIVMAEPRLDATFGSIPNIGQLIGGSRLFPELPTRFANSGGNIDLFTNIWMSPDGDNLFGGVGARPLMIPTAIDQYGCINTVQA
jgi:hypothetical protein